MADEGSAIDGAVTIRLASRKDEPALTRIDLDTRRPEVTPAPEPDAGFRFFDGRAEPEDTLVATVDDEICGLCALTRPTPLDSNRHVLEIVELSVSPSHQRRGIGTALLEAAAEFAAQRGCTKLRLRVLATNPAALKLYEACGFVVEGTLRNEFRVAGVYVDDLLMARSV